MLMIITAMLNRIPAPYFNVSRVLCRWAGGKRFVNEGNHFTTGLGKGLEKHMSLGCFS